SFDASYSSLFLSLFRTAVDLEMAQITPVCVFFVYLSTVWKQQLLEENITDEEVDALRAWVRNENRKSYYSKLWRRGSLLKPRGNVNRAYTSRYTPTLLQYGEDYTKQ